MRPACNVPEHSDGGQVLQHVERSEIPSENYQREKLEDIKDKSNIKN